MKEIISLLMCGFLILGITGCGNEDNSNDKKEDTSWENVYKAMQSIASQCELQ